MKKTEYRDYSEKSYKYMKTGTVIMIVLAIITAMTFGYFMKLIVGVEQSTQENYNKHYAFVSEDVDTELYRQVYESAKAKAEDDGIFLENVKDSINADYSNEDLLRIAINSNVDGIIYAGTNSPEVKKLIGRAVYSGIGIVILHNDIEDTNRQCYVGVNNYELGEVYGHQIQKTLNNECANATVELYASKYMSEGALNLIILAIEDTLRETLSEDEFPQIEIIRIAADDTFSVEEEIRNRMMKNESLPDVIVCLEDKYTQCVYQAMVDYNHVGEVQVIGYYANSSILEAIDKKIINSTVSVDAKKMGMAGVEALEEYNEMGYTNSYIPIDIEVIDKSMAAKLLLNAAEQGE